MYCEIKLSSDYISGILSLVLAIISSFVMTLTGMLYFHKRKHFPIDERDPYMIGCVLASILFLFVSTTLSELGLKDCCEISMWMKWVAFALYINSFSIRLNRYFIACQLIDKHYSIRHSLTINDRQSLRKKVWMKLLFGFERMNYGHRVIWVFLGGSLMGLVIPFMLNFWKEPGECETSISSIMFYVFMALFAIAFFFSSFYLRKYDNKTKIVKEMFLVTISWSIGLLFIAITIGVISPKGLNVYVSEGFWIILTQLASWLSVTLYPWMLTRDEEAQKISQTMERFKKKHSDGTALDSSDMESELVATKKEMDEFMLSDQADLFKTMCASYNASVFYSIYHCYLMIHNPKKTHLLSEDHTTIYNTNILVYHFNRDFPLSHLVTSIPQQYPELIDRTKQGISFFFAQNQLHYQDLFLLNPLDPVTRKRIHVDYSDMVSRLSVPSSFNFTPLEERPEWEKLSPEEKLNLEILREQNIKQRQEEMDNLWPLESEYTNYIGTVDQTSEEYEIELENVTFMFNYVKQWPLANKYLFKEFIECYVLDIILDQFIVFKSSKEFRVGSLSENSKARQKMFML